MWRVVVHHRRDYIYVLVRVRGSGGISVGAALRKQGCSMTSCITRDIFRMETCGRTKMNPRVRQESLKICQVEQWEEIDCKTVREDNSAGVP